MTFLSMITINGCIMSNAVFKLLSNRSVSRFFKHLSIHLCALGKCLNISREKWAILPFLIHTSSFPIHLQLCQQCKYCLFHHYILAMLIMQTNCIICLFVKAFSAHSLNRQSLGVSVLNDNSPNVITFRGHRMSIKSQIPMQYFSSIGLNVFGPVFFCSML